MPRKRPTIYFSCLLYEPAPRARGEQVGNGRIPNFWEELRTALAELPVGQREVIEARYGFCGPDQSFGEIGQRLGITKQAVQCREKAGIRNLRKLLDQKRTLN